MFSRAIFTLPLLYQQLFYAVPPPPAPAPEPPWSFAVTTTVPYAKTLYYQANIIPPPTAALQDAQDALEAGRRPDKWMQRWQGPPKYQPNRGPFAAHLVAEPPAIPAIPAITPDKWLIGWTGPPRYTPNKGPFTNFTSTEPPPEVVDNINAATRVTTGSVFSKSLFYQSAVRPPYAAAEVVVGVTVDQWLVPLTRAAPRLSTTTALYSPFVPSIAPQPTADEWLQPFRRQVAGPSAPAGGSPFVPREAVLDNTVTPDAWMPSWRGPPSYHPAPAGGSPFVPKEAVRENTVTPDAWMVPLSRAAPIPRITQPTQPFYGYPTEAVDNSRFEWDWSIAWQGPPRYQPPRIAAQPFVPREAVLENTVTPDAWMPSWRGPPRVLQQLAAGIVYPPQGVVQVNTRTEWDWQINWQGPPRYTQPLASGLFYSPAGPTVASLTTTLEWMQAWRGPPSYRPAPQGCAPFVPREAVRDNTQTPDKWLRPLGTVPPRYVPPKILAQPFVPREAVLDNTVTPDKWQIKWQGPPRYQLVLPGGTPFVAKEAVLENTVTVEKWLVRFAKAVPVPKPVPSQPVLGYPYESQAIVVPYEQWWQQPLSRAAARPAVHSKPYQPFVPREAVAENTQTPDKWLQRWRGPPRITPIKVQTPPFVPREATAENTVTPDKWHRDLGRAVARPSVAPTQPGWSYAPVAADNTVSIDKWQVPLSVAVPAPKARPTQPIYTPVEPPVVVVEQEFIRVETFGAARYHKSLFYQALVQPYYPYRDLLTQHVQAELTVSFHRMLRYTCRAEQADRFESVCQEAFADYAFQNDAFQVCLEEAVDPWSTQVEQVDVSASTCQEAFASTGFQGDAFQVCAEEVIEESDPWAIQAEAADPWGEQQQSPSGPGCDECR